MRTVNKLQSYIKFAYRLILIFFVCFLFGLSPGHIKAVAIPSVQTSGQESIQSEGTTFLGNLMSNGGSVITSYGFEYGADVEYGTQIYTNGSISGDYSQIIGTLSCFTQYHFRAYATNIAGTGYGSDDTFTTLNCRPDIENTSASNITKTSADLGANIISTGGEGMEVTSRGMLYLLAEHLVDGSPDSMDNVFTTAFDDTPGVGEFTETVTGLTCGTDYVYASFVSNEPGGANDKGASGVVEFTTLPCSSSSYSYSSPPSCDAKFTPSTINLGEKSTLSWDIMWSGKRSSYYVKVPLNGIFSSSEKEAIISPTHTTTYQLASINLFGANFCEAIINVLDEDGNEIIDQKHSYLESNSIKSPLGSIILNILKRIFRLI